MTDKYKEASTSLDFLVSLLQEFEITKNDYKKPDIRAYQNKLTTLGKIINSQVLKHIEKLNDDIDIYLANPKKDKYQKIIQDAIKLKDDLWEL